MSRRTLLPYLIVVIGLTGTASAQWSEPSAQWSEPGHSYFEPLVEFEEYDLLDTGYYTSFERVFWTEHWERPTVGSPDAIRRHVQIWGPGAPSPVAFDALVALGVNNPAETINPIALPIVSNGLGQLFPNFEIDQGNRFIFGHRDGNVGWEVSVLTPFEMTLDQVYGIGYTGQDETLGGLGIVEGDGVAELPGLGDLLPQDPNQLASPFGSVMILFDYEPGLMNGFIDVRDGVVVDGPPGDVIEDDSNGNGILDGDGLADDVNLNGVYGPDGVSTGTAFLPDAEIPPGMIDFGDLVELPTSFHVVNVRNILKTSSIQLMRSKTLQSARNGRTGVEMLYGFRYTAFDDNFFFRGEGGVLGRSFWNTGISNRLMGPQIGCRWVKRHGRWGLTADARGLLAVNVENWEQDASIGEDLIPSQHNHPLYFSPTVSHHGLRKYEFAPMGELKLTSSYQLTKGVSLNLGYNGLFATGIRRASTHVKYRLPNMGFADGKQETILMSGLNLGVTFAH